LYNEKTGRQSKKGLLRELTVTERSLANQRQISLIEVTINERAELGPTTLATISGELHKKTAKTALVSAPHCTNTRGNLMVENRLDVSIIYPCGTLVLYEQVLIGG
jgi:hypothetical protein